MLAKRTCPRLGVHERRLARQEIALLQGESSSWTGSKGEEAREVIRLVRRVAAIWSSDHSWTQTIKTSAVTHRHKHKGEQPPVVYYWCKKGRNNSQTSPSTPLLSCKMHLLLSGRCWVRTSDPLLVREKPVMFHRSQLRVVVANIWLK